MATQSSNQQDAPVQFTLHGAPLPAPRPRFRVIRSKTGASFVSTYYDKKYSDYLKRAPIEIQQRTACDVNGPLEGALALTVRFYIERPKSTKRDTPRFDIDNYLKSIMDAMTHAGVWSDDDQVATVFAQKVWADEEGPHTTVFVEKVDG